ncbi:hypothetical protein AVEN_29200-1 [Araneus ventricosus]|uniref:DDE Tnp4 domain-containing protein n=1 Tax=Araneus ventricosus TaxID=182803 RepID=A0A4Y2AKI8_ARAVE|nr:hypothetical protein AVEN_29200-1 [Araneus ventricosus]
MSQSTMSRTLNLVTDLIYSKISTVGIWPEKNKVIENMPYVFRSNFPQCRVIVDCTEFPIQKPSNPKEQQLTFSSYKNTNTVKCHVGIAPSGGISFISEAWGGSVSYKELFLKCGIIDLLEPGDEDIMTDDDQSTFEAFNAVFGPSIRHLLCKWHVLCSWSRQLHAKASDKQLVKEMNLGHSMSSDPELVA